LSGVAGRRAAVHRRDDGQPARPLRRSHPRRHPWGRTRGLHADRGRHRGRHAGAARGWSWPSRHGRARCSTTTSGNTRKRSPRPNKPPRTPRSCCCRPGRFRSASRRLHAPDTATARPTRCGGSRRPREPSGSGWALGIEPRSYALLTEGDAADSLYREAIERLGRTRLRVPLARARLLYGEWLRHNGRRTEARDQLRTAHEMLTAMGVEAFAQRAAAAPRGSRDRPQRRRPELPPAQGLRDARHQLARSGRARHVTAKPSAARNP